MFYLTVDKINIVVPLSLNSSDYVGVIQKQREWSRRKCKNKQNLCMVWVKTNAGKNERKESLFSLLICSYTCFAYVNRALVLTLLSKNLVWHFICYWGKNCNNPRRSLEINRKHSSWWTTVKLFSANSNLINFISQGRFIHFYLYEKYSPKRPLITYE